SENALLRKIEAADERNNNQSQNQKYDGKRLSQSINAIKYLDPLCNIKAMHLHNDPGYNIAPSSFFIWSRGRCSVTWIAKIELLEFLVDSFQELDPLRIRQQPFILFSQRRIQARHGICRESAGCLK